VGMVLVVDPAGLAGLFARAAELGLGPWLLGQVRQGVPTDIPDAAAKGGTGGITVLAGEHPRRS
jgi:hypothetical protein